MNAAVVSGCDAAPVFELCEHVLDLMSFAIEGSVIGQLNFPVFFRRDARFDAAHNEGSAEPVAVVALVGDQA